jgi:hypothetical protein
LGGAYVRTWTAPTVRSDTSPDRIDRTGRPNPDRIQRHCNGSPPSDAPFHDPMPLSARLRDRPRSRRRTESVMRRPCGR